MDKTDAERAAHLIRPVNGLLRAQCREASREGNKDWWCMLDRPEITKEEILAAYKKTGVVPMTKEAEKAMLQAARREIGNNLRSAWRTMAFGD
jgi:hypothetical protein